MPAATVKNPMSLRDHEQLQLITFTVSHHECAIEIQTVREIMKMDPLVSVASANPALEGTVTRNGDVIPVVNLRSKLGVPRHAFDTGTRIIIVEIHSKPIGFVVDCVREMLRISREVVDTAPAMACGIDPDFMTGVGRFDNRMLILLDLESLFAFEASAAKVL